MTKEIWLNLPVKDVHRSVTFFKALGFEFDEQHSTSEMASMRVGSKKFVVMLFNEDVLQVFMQHPVANTAAGSEMMISIDAESKADVDDMTARIEAAGGKVFAPPSEIQGWMYGSAFTDPDGHRWNILYMDMAKQP